MVVCKCIACGQEFRISKKTANKGGSNYECTIELCNKEEQVGFIIVNYFHVKDVCPECANRDMKEIVKIVDYRDCICR